MKECIYCGELKEDSTFTLEHVIPQCLGGAYAPNEFKTRDVCKDCNSKLGLFVDASFEKNHFVSQQLHINARAFFDPENPKSLPLICNGLSELSPPGMTDDEVCELWLGPFGEAIYWIRKDDERMRCYAGGNPITAKNKDSSAYFFLNESSKKNIDLVLLSFQDAFGRKRSKRKRQRVKKVLDTRIENREGSTQNSPKMSELGRARVDYFRQQLKQGQPLHSHRAVNVYFDRRFSAKLALGFSYVLFGKKIRDSEYFQELRKGVWYKPGNSIPKVKGTSTFSGVEIAAQEYIGVKYGVTVTVCPMHDVVGVTLKVGQMSPISVVCAETKELSDTQISSLGNGFSLVLFDSLEKCIRLTLPELIAHNTGEQKHSELSKIEEIADKQSFCREIE